MQGPQTVLKLNIRCFSQENYIFPLIITESFQNQAQKESMRCKKVISNPLSHGMPLTSLICNDSGTFLPGGERSHSARTPKEGKLKTEAACKVEDFTQDAA